MAQLVDNNIILKLGRQTEDAIIKIEIAGGRTTAPAGSLIADGHLFIRKNISEIGIVATKVDQSLMDDMTGSFLVRNIIEVRRSTADKLVATAKEAARMMVVTEHTLTILYKKGAAQSTAQSKVQKKGRARLSGRARHLVEIFDSILEKKIGRTEHKMVNLIWCPILFALSRRGG